MTKILNLDELETTVERSITYKGVEHVMVPFTVETFINQMKEIEEIGDREPTGSEMYEKSVAMIQRAFPSLSDDIVKQMKTHQLDAIYNFLKTRSDDEVEKAAASGN